jgi:phage shock protein PspC (stress-responsive transcriptional regulator)
MFAGVCNGIAAYAGVDVTMVRILFLVLAVITKGGFGLAYLALAFVVPTANTSEERAAARGQTFNAQELIDRAKKNYADFKSRRDWRRQWRDARRRWRWQAWRAPAPPSVPAGGYGARIMTGVLVPILGLISLLCFWFWLWAIYSLVTTNEVLGQTLPDDMPLWGGILILVVVYQAVAWPLHNARRHIGYYSFGGMYHRSIAWDGVMSLGVGILVVWVAYRYLPEAREIIRTMPDVWDSFTR